jgi:hypothetical protein
MVNFLSIGVAHQSFQLVVWSLIHNEKPIVLFERNCLVTEKSEVICMCKEMPVILVNRVVDPK